MSFLNSAAVFPMWQLLVIGGMCIFMIIVLAGLLFMFISVPEIRVLFRAAYMKRYVLFNHSSYSVGSIRAVKFSEVSLEPLKGEVKFKPRGKDDVEQTGRIHWIHSHELTPYPISSTTAFIVDRFVNEMKKQGLPASISNVDALLRCQLDPAKMIGYVDDFVWEEIPVFDNEGNPVFDELKDPDGNEFKKAVFERKLVKKTYQMQISDKDLEVLTNIKQKLETTWVGVDSDGSDIFSWSHMEQVVSILMAGTPVIIDDLQSVAERRGATKKGKGDHNLMLYAIVAVILAIAGGTFLKFIGVV